VKNWGYIAADRATIEADLIDRGYQRHDFAEEERLSASVIADRQPSELIHIWRTDDDRIEVSQTISLDGSLWTRIDSYNDLSEYSGGARILDGEDDEGEWRAVFGSDDAEAGE
jgi:hypothetical protein